MAACWGELQNLNNISELRNKAPELVTDILDDQNRKFGVEHTDVDVKTLMQQEGGSELVANIAEREGITQDELQACAEGHGMLRVKTSTLQQLMPEMEAKKKETLLSNITKDSNYKTDNQVMQEIEVASRQKMILQKLMKQDIGKTIDNVVKARFSDDAEEAKLAREIMEANFDDPAAEIRQRLAKVNMELQEKLAPTIRRLRSGMKQGVTYATDQEGLSTGERISNNDPWWQNWSADHGYKDITNREMEELAADIVAGREDPRYSIDMVDYRNLSEEERAGLTREGEQLDALFDMRDRLESLREKMKDLKPGDLAATRTLSADGQKVYAELKRDFAQKTGSDEARKSSDFNALLWSMYCEERAKAFSDAYKKPFTAMDYYHERLRFELNAVEGQAQTQMKNAAQLMQPVNVIQETGEKYTPIDFNELADEIGAVGMDDASVQSVLDYIKEIVEKDKTVTTKDLSAVFNLKGIDSGATAQHIALAHSIKGRKEKKSRLVRNKTLSNLGRVLSEAILVEIAPTKHSDGYYKNALTDKEADYTYRFVIPIKIEDQARTLVITAEGFGNVIKPIKNDITLYEVFTTKNSTADGDLSLHAIDDAKEESKPSSKLTLSQILWNVKDLSGNRYVDKDTGEINFADKLYDIGIHIRKFNQKQGSVAKGTITFSQNTPQKIISLFETADQSTAMHEMAHLYLLDLQELAGLAGPDSQYAKDLQTILEWAEWKDGQTDEYTGTASAAEFLKRDAAIKAALKAGDTKKAEELKNEWIQERFARGFEEYLRQGTAPTMGLQKAFRTFKRWLSRIYKGYLGAGGRATPEVEAVMARMLASEEEIETMAAADNVARLEKIDPDILETDAGKMLERWKEEAKEQAKEQLLKELLAEYDALDVETHLAEYREQVESELMKRACFTVQALVKDGDSLEQTLESFGYGSKEEYEAELAELGGSYEKAVDKAVEAERERYKRTPVQQQDLYEKAREAVSSGDYNTRLATLESELLNRRKDKYNGIPEKVSKVMHGIDRARAAGEIEKLRQEIKALKYAQRWREAEYDLILDMERGLAVAEEKAKAEEVLKRFDAEYDALKKATVQNKEWLRGVRDATIGKSEAIRNEVRNQMAEMPISASTNFRMWHRKEMQEGNRAWKAISRAQNENTGVSVPEGQENLRPNIGEEYARAARQAKISQATFAAMTAEAIRIKRKIVTPILNKIKRRQKTMSGKNFKMDANCRYFHEHILYVYGLRTSDVRPPVGEDALTFEAWLLEKRESGEINETIVPDLVKTAMATNDPLKDYQQLTYGELQALSDFCDILYTLGRNQNIRLTDGVSMDQVEEDCSKSYQETVDYHVGLQKINEVKGAMGKYMASLMKTETMLSILGGKQGAFIRYIYKTLADAADQEERAREKEAEFINGYDIKNPDGTKTHVKGLYETYYTKEELRKICNDDLKVTGEDGLEHRLELGDDKHITKEMILCMALNWGNTANRVRLCNGLEMTEDEVMDLMKQFMTQNDWNFVQAMWDHIEEFGDPVSGVVEKLCGVPMKRVQAEAFTVDLGNGTGLKMRGGYYPIAYDPGKSLRQATFEQMEQASTMGGASVLGTGMGNTKDRAGDNFKGNGPLILELRVAHSHIQGQLHIIHSKLAVRDAYKVISNKLVAAQISGTFGPEMYKAMKENVLSCWQAPMKPNDWYEKVVGKVRSKTVGAIMKYRLSTALLNFANIVYMAQEIGSINAIHAVYDFYKHPSLNREFVKNSSVFMRNRATNMDRDLNAVADSLYAHHNAVVNKLADVTGGRSMEAARLIDKYANWAIEETDMIFSMPLYYWQFKQTYNAEIQNPDVSEVEARETANYEATRRVTKVFSSNRTIDTSAVQRSRSEITRLFTPFFSFANMMMNAVWSKYYAGKYQYAKVEMRDDAGNVVRNPDGSPKLVSVEKDFKRRWGGFVRAAVMDFVLGAFVETCLRRIPGLLAGGGDDDEDWMEKLRKETFKNAVDSATGGLPLINLLTDPLTGFVLSAAAGEKIPYNNRRAFGVIMGSVERLYKPFEDAGRILQGSQKIDLLDMMRDVVRATNIKTGLSDTLTDAMFNTMRFATDEGYSLDNMEDLREYIAKTLFDKKLKKK